MNDRMNGRNGSGANEDNGTHAIRTKTTDKSIKVLDRADEASRHVRDTFARAKDTASNTADDSYTSPEEYAEDRTVNAARETAGDVKNGLSRAGNHARDHLRLSMDHHDIDTGQSAIQSIERDNPSGGDIAGSRIRTRQQNTQQRFRRPATSGARGSSDSARSIRTLDRTIRRSSEKTARDTRRSIKTAERSSRMAIKTAEAAAKTSEKAARASAKAAKASMKTAEAAARASAAVAKAFARAAAWVVKMIVSAVKSLVAAIAGG